MGCSLYCCCFCYNITNVKDCLSSIILDYIFHIGMGSNIQEGEVSGKPETARSYRGSIIDDNAVVSLNLKWLGQILVLVGCIVYGYYRIETRIGRLEDSMVEADEQIGDLLDKHMADEQVKREELEEKVSFYEKEFNINPLSWGKRKKNK